MSDDEIQSDYNEEQISNIKNEMKLGNKQDQKFIYYHKTNLEENENNIQVKGKSISFANVLKNFNVSEVMNETSQAKLKKSLENFVKNKDKSKVEIQFNDTQTKVLERSANYSTVVKEISKYQDKVKINREADVLDFTKGIHSVVPTTVKALANNNKDANNDYEKMIKDVLIKSKCDTDDKILEEENKLLVNVNPEEMKKRYEELKRIKSLLFQQELSNKRKAKIKSKLYHKIKKKQKEREEGIILKQLEEVDPEAVKNYIEKKKMDRIKERIELKHSFNSQFNKTVKRYNLHNDVEVREKIKENYKLRDELMKKIKGQEEDEDGEDEDESDQHEEDNHEEQGDDDIEDDEADSNEENSEEDDENIDKSKLLIDFEEKENNTNTKEDQNNKGVFGMKFMKNAENLQNKLKDVLNEIDSDEESFNEEDDSDQKFKAKPQKKRKVNSDEETNENENIFTHRKTNMIEKEEKTETATTTKKITHETLQDLSNDAKKYVKPNENIKATMNKEELKKLIDEENMLEEEEMFKKFLVQNEENKKEFLTNETNKTEKSNDLLVGWGSWAGDSKPIKAKEFLQRKRYEDRQKKKVQITSEDVNKNPYVKVNNSFDKNFSNYLVKEIPYNVHSKEEFDRLNSTGVGKEWNTLSVYKKLIQPSVVKRIGQIIEPMQIADTTGAQKLCEIIEKVTKKKQRTKAKL